jgi:hypothetical protein
MDSVPKRRWLRFSLRTLFVLTTAVAVLVGWVVYERDWVRQRHQFLREQELAAGPPSPGAAVLILLTDAPGQLWMFGEDGYATVDVYVDETAPGAAATIDRARRLFPEAMINIVKPRED